MEFYRSRLQEAVLKARASPAPNVRQAYFDLACFYREKLRCGAACGLCNFGDGEGLR